MGAAQSAIDVVAMTLVEKVAVMNVETEAKIVSVVNEW